MLSEFALQDRRIGIDGVQLTDSEISLTISRQ
jgi:hypothetical protein